jgi:hypothetical protein
MATYGLNHTTAWTDETRWLRDAKHYVHVRISGMEAVAEAWFILENHSERFKDQPGWGLTLTRSVAPDWASTGAL